MVPFHYKELFIIGHAFIRQTVKQPSMHYRLLIIATISPANQIIIVHTFFLTYIFCKLAEIP